METIALSKDQHAHSLERLCVAALSSGDAETAFMFADRRCRVLPHVGPHHFTLRAEALMRLGERDAAVSDLSTALALSPEDIQANRRMLTWGSEDQKSAAARALVGSDDDAGVLAQALAVLRELGSEATGAARMTDDAIIGWAAWNGLAAPVLSISDHEGEASLALTADEAHPLADCGFDHVAGFHLQRTRSPIGHALRLALAQDEFFRLRGSANAAVVAGTPRIDDRPLLQQDHPAELTVIVPVYRDFHATRACLDGLAPEIGRRAGYRAILVNDATPEQELADYLSDFARSPGFTVLTNDSNLGFVGSVNRALELVATGDVVLLNADTIVPKDCLARMAAIAQADPTIGTITPLSNNGEFTSFPVPFAQNPLPMVETIHAIDVVAADVNRCAVVDLPNGIGFCLYVTRRCLEAVGSLSQVYHRGYLEDVDFCLRARERGFRNVCAAAIYVGHAGSRSFGADKRALVVRNVAITETRFPDYREQCALFMSADPLRRARAAIERRLLSGQRFERLLVCGNGALKAVAEARATGREGPERALLLYVERAVLTLQASDRDIPQSLTFACDMSGLAALRETLRAVELQSIEIIEPGAVSGDLLQTLESLGRPLGVVAADAGLVCPRGTLIQSDGRVCTTLGADAVCPECVPSTRDHACASRQQWRARWPAISSKDLPDERARGFASFVIGGARMPDRMSGVRLPHPSPPLRRRAGFIVQTAAVDELQTMQRFLRAALQRLPEQTFLVVGQTADDLALMAIGNVFVSGAVESGDCESVLRQYSIEKLILPLRRPLFGHPAAQAARRTALPMAYFDWSFGRSRPRPDDLAIDPRCGLDELTTLLGEWVES